MLQVRTIKVSRGCLGEEELAAVREAFDYGYFGHAGKVVEFEARLCDYFGVKDVVATNSGTSALHLALDGLGIGPGDEVIVPSLTFVASFQAVRMTGAEPVACDLDPSSLLMDLADAERRITSRTRAIMPVHYGGKSCDMVGLREMAQRHGLILIEDAAQAFGSTWRGRRVGTLGDAACFSFDSIKNITCGEGGAIVCHDADLAARLRRRRALGMDRSATPVADGAPPGWQFDVAEPGFRYHMSNINAAIGLAQFAKAESFIARRRAICLEYDRALAGLDGLTTLNVNYDEVAPHIYVVRVINRRRDALMQFLKSEGIETGINYIPNHLHRSFRQSGAPLPETEKAFGEILTLPLHYGLSPSDLEFVIETILKFFSK